MKAQVTLQHGESKSIFYVVNADAAEQYQPSIIATFTTTHDGIMANAKAQALARAINQSVREEPAATADNPRPVASSAPRVS
jgi:hypothetical protein